MEAYIEFLISARLFFEAPETSVDNTPLMRYLSWSMLAICLVVIPGLYFWIMLYDTAYLKKSKHLHRRVYPIFEDIDIRNKWNLLYNIIYVYRRVVYVEIAFRLSDHPCQQI